MNTPQHSPRTGTVYLIGSGPGALDLLTLRAARLIAEADAIVYDHLIADGVLDLVRADAQKIYVGKVRITPFRRKNSTCCWFAWRTKGRKSFASRAATRSFSDAAERKSKPSLNSASPSKWCRASRQRQAVPLTQAFR
jgi:hypothetical protein